MSRSATRSVFCACTLSSLHPFLLDYENMQVWITRSVVITREIIGWQISVRHDTQLVLGAIKHAIAHTGATPIYLHQIKDQNMTQKHTRTIRWKKIY